MKTESSQQQNVTEHKRFLEQYIVDITHDLKNPIYTIQGITDLMLREIFGPLNEKQREALNKIKEHVRFSYDLIERVLEVSRIESGEFKLQRENVHIVGLLHEICQNNQILADKKTIHIEFIPGDDPLIFLDHLRFKQIMNNLVSNAIKFSNPHTKILISTKIHEHNFNIYINDQGPGIRPEEIKDLFVKFKQLTPKATDGEKGSGLGLTIAKTLVEQHQGEITVESQVGIGTTFCISLPMVE